MIKQPFKFSAAKVSIEDQSRFVLECCFMSSSLKFIAVNSSAAILPDDRIMNRLACFAIPDYRGFSLIGNPDSSNITGSDTNTRQGFISNAHLGRPNFISIMLHPTRMRKDLLKLFLSNGQDIAITVKYNRA